MEKQRERFRRTSYCRATPDGNNDVYKATHQAHLAFVKDEERTESRKKELNVTFNMPVMTKPTSMTENTIRLLYKEVRVCGEWITIRKFYGGLEQMFKDGYKFK